ncbi:RidA family protein [Pseudomonas sp. Teo4]|uniref:RidA family protein n=1 Tax=Pseudomonas sp. Teo4 TaxID=3064528 RepID=UPI002ABB7E3A|nr:RidA family protein [Pseudomonas sp. Teo4]MDZ3992617.1 hypothetical protein [Pseudomonas sp. Teo4]
MSYRTFTEALKELNLELPATNAPRGSYAPAIKAGDLLFVAGQAPRVNGELKFSGRVGHELTIEQGREAAQLCALNVLGHLAHATGDDPSKVVTAVRLAGVVNSAEDFTAHSQVLDAASDLIAKVLGTAGQHARIATGASSLPSGMAVEIEAIFQLK